MLSSSRWPTARPRSRRPLRRSRLRLRRRRNRPSPPARPASGTMADPRFFDRAGPFSLEALAALSGAQLRNSADGERLIADVSPLESAGPEDLTFLYNREYVEAFSRSQAGAAFVDERLALKAPSNMALLVTREPYKAFARAAQAFYPIK